MEVNIYNNQSNLSIPIPEVKNLVRQVLADEGCACDEVAIHFINSEEILELHANYFNDPTPTDCITFPIDSPQEQGYRMLGDVFVCPQTAIEYAQKNQEDPYKETSLYIVHGLLHLLGYDDLDEENERIMRLKESHHLNQLMSKGLCLTQEHH